MVADAWPSRSGTTFTGTPSASNRLASAGFSPEVLKQRGRYMYPKHVSGTRNAHPFKRTDPGRPLSSLLSLSVAGDSFRCMTATRVAAASPAKCPHCEWTPPSNLTAKVTWLWVAQHVRVAHNDWSATKRAHRNAHAAVRAGTSK